MSAIKQETEVAAEDDFDVDAFLRGRGMDPEKVRQERAEYFRAAQEAIVTRRDRALRALEAKQRWTRGGKPVEADADEF